MSENMFETPVLPWIPEAVRPQLDQILSGEFLGASRNIRQINDLMVRLAELWPTPSGQELVITLRALGDYLIATRGRNTPAIANAVRLFLQDFERQQDLGLDAIRSFVSARQAELNARSLGNARLIAENGARLLRDARVVMPFDYSSSVMAIFKCLAEEKHFLRLIVPESRILDGGRPIVREVTEWGHTVDYIVDMAFWHFLAQIECVLVGAETILANGDCWTTIGSYAIAALGKNLHIPFYVATDLSKIDPNSFVGKARQIKPVDASRILNYPAAFAHPERISVLMPDMDNVPAALITGYITPDGILPPEKLHDETARFLRSTGMDPETIGAPANRV